MTPSGQQQQPAILHLGLHIGFAGGIERYAWQTAQTLAAHGIHNDYAGSIPSRDPKRFADAFRRILTIEKRDESLVNHLRIPRFLLPCATPA